MADEFAVLANHMKTIDNLKASKLEIEQTEKNAASERKLQQNYVDVLNALCVEYDLHAQYLQEIARDIKSVKVLLGQSNRDLSVLHEQRERLIHSRFDVQVQQANELRAQLGLRRLPTWNEQEEEFNRNYLDARRKNR